jgi:hypothetical protein
MGILGGMNVRTRTHRVLALGLALSGLGAFGAAAAPALAQYGGGPAYNNSGPMYNRWQPGWDAGNYDRRHILVGTVTSFTPYRMQLAGPRGPMQVDLVPGTVIRPTGLNLAPGERVAAMGHWSRGTFVAYRVVLRRG